MGNVHVDYLIPHVSGLHAIADLGYDATTGYGTNKVPADAAQEAANSPGPGLNSKYKTNTTYVQAIYQLNYIKDIPSIKSNINLTGLYTYANTATTQYNYVSYDAAHDTLSGSAPVYPTNPADYTMISYVGRLIYTFDQKYILTASIRDDSSSKFSPSNRWGDLPGRIGSVADQTGKIPERGQLADRPQTPGQLWQNRQSGRYRRLRIRPHLFAELQFLAV